MLSYLLFSFLVGQEFILAIFLQAQPLYKDKNWQQTPTASMLVW